MTSFTSRFANLCRHIIANLFGTTDKSCNQRRIGVLFHEICPRRPPLSDQEAFDLSTTNKSSGELQPFEPLRLRIAPHMVQDLGLNLYTSLPKVLVEFVANAHDADSPFADIRLDENAIRNAREEALQELKAQRESEKTGVQEYIQSKLNENQKTGAGTKTKKSALLPDAITISVTDHGHGMSRQDIQDKFLLAGRRRREADDTSRSPNGRLLMGRKGLGKLAGFGVAEVMEVTSREKGAEKATRFTLDFVQIQASPSVSDFPLPEELIDDPTLLPDGGTIVTLKRLLYEPTKTSIDEIQEDVSSHFYIVKPEQFEIRINGIPLAPQQKKFAYAHPEPDTGVNELVKHTIEPEDGESYEIEYRLRFVEDRSALIASQRGVRVYTHQRLASMPSLLHADTNMHGFRMTDYLDGVVFCDAIDDQDVDLVATDRQGLRWDTPMLAPLREFLSAEIKEACKQRQKVRDQENEQKAESNSIVREIVDARQLSTRETKTFQKIAAAISSTTKKGFEDPDFKAKLEVFADAYVQGNLFEELNKLSQQDDPDFEEIASKVVQLTSEELDHFFKFCKARLWGVEGLRKIVESVDFAAHKNEDVLHGLFNKCPWLIDPTFFEFLTSNQREGSLLKSLEKELEVGPYVKTGYDKTTDDETAPLKANKRPDLVFLLGSIGLRRIVIVELKAPNTPLHIDHLTQLQGYIARVEKWIEDRKDLEGAIVHGYLIGSHAKPDSSAEKVLTLKSVSSKFGPESPVHVLGIDEMLERTKRVHREILDISDKLDEDTAH